MIRLAASSLVHLRTALTDSRAGAALAGFLRGFTGVASTRDGCAGHAHDRGVATPAAMRDALSEQVARRGRCC